MPKMKFVGLVIEKLEPKQRTQTLVSSCDPDHDPLTLIYKLDVDILKLYMYMHTKMKFLAQVFQKLKP